MYRFIPVFDKTLLCIDPPAVAKNNPKPPAISACHGKIRITNIRWRRPDWNLEGTDRPNLETHWSSGNAK
jgi:hypothetical protein